MEKQENEFDPFFVPFEKFSNDIYPVDEYIKQATKYISKVMNMEEDVARAEVIKIVKSSNLRNPTTKFYYKQDNGDKIVREEKLTDYIKESIKCGDIIVPSFTTYYSPEKQKSIHAEFMDYNTKRRSIHKKAAFKAKQDGEMDKFLYNDVMQKTMKIFNNSLSGAYASKSTVLRNPSAHYTLTSMTRCVASVGNALTESIVYGNKHFKDANTTFNYLTTIITNYNAKFVQYCIDKFKLHIPTVDEIMESILYSTQWYWQDDVAEKQLRDYIWSMNELDRVAVMYTNDFWHLRMYNEKLIRDFITSTIQKKTDITDDPSIFKKIPETLEILTKLICYEELRGKNVDYEAFRGTELGFLLCSTATNVLKMFNSFSMLFKTFILTNIMPPTIAYVKEMFRQCIVLSDTDSTCGSYDKWVEWYLGRLSFKDDSIPIVAVIMTINSQAVEHGLRILSKNMNLPKERMEILKMKNEFYWPVFITTNKNKHYFASTAIQEGNVYKEHDLEIKGVHLIASAVDQKVSKAVHAMIKEINSRITNNEQISVLEYVKKVADMERDIIKRIEEGDITIFKKDSIKEEKAYKLSKEQSPYINHILWQDVFEHKYGSPGSPPYMTIKIPTLLDSNKKTVEYINNIEDTYIRNGLLEFMSKYKKNNFGTFRPPLTIVGSKGLPKELINCIDKDRIVMDNLNSAYLVLEAIGFYKKEDKILSKLGY